MKQSINSILINKTVLFLIHVLFPILLGGFIYLLFRSKSLIMFNWFKVIGILDLIQSFRNSFYDFKTCIPNWIYFSIPDALWVYSFTSTILLFESNWKVLTFWLLVPFLFGPLIEIFQLFRLFPGTFDPLDLLFTSIAFMFSILIFNYNKNRKNETKII